MASPTNPEAQEAGKYIGLSLAVAGTLAIGLSPSFIFFVIVWLSLEAWEVEGERLGIWVERLKAQGLSA